MKKMKERFSEKFSLERMNCIINNPCRPKCLVIEVASACNHSCVFCNYHSNFAPHTVKDTIINESLLNKLIIEASKTEIGYEELGFFITGEPLLFKELEKYIKLAKELGFKYTYLTTNGVLADKERIKKLLESGLDSLRFSVNAGTRESYKEIHGADDFEKVYENIKILYKYKNETNNKISTSISMIVTKKTLNERELLNEKFGKYVDDIIYIPVDYLNTFPNSMKEEFELEKKSTYTYKPCVSVFNTMYINAEGNVKPCCLSMNNDDMTIDSVLSGKTLVEIWNSEKYIMYRDKFKNKEMPDKICNNCSMLNSEKVLFLD